MTSSLQDDITTLKLVQPERIVKARIQEKIECYEVEWENVQLGETCPASFVTIETKQLFAQVYPQLVKEFNDNEVMKLSKKSPKKSKIAFQEYRRTKPHSKDKKARREEHEEVEGKGRLLEGSAPAKHPAMRNRALVKTRKTK
ncbi:Flap endonuclease GEN 1 [Desmophyllum pertusum]|uniref:Flap endonuclease GEN 1 n=1 Tax=Desmophyllum pertusum TaxID=174260 RepID=A0A9X0A388_9CNID|nr:Flap endonuclease GEN 1 [Desmophyllum pertusum]